MDNLHSTDPGDGCFLFFSDTSSDEKTERLKNFREALKKGDKVVTAGGIYGKINNISKIL